MKALFWVMAAHLLVAAGIFLVQGCSTTPEWMENVSVPRHVDPPPPTDLPPEVSEPEPVAPAEPIFESDMAPEPAPMPEPEYKHYTIRKGDTLSAIAYRHDISVSTLVELNEIQNPDRLVVGQDLLLPPYAAEPAARPSAPSPGAVRESGAEAGDGEIYVVKSGDTLSQIAQRFNVALDRLRDVNGLRGDRIIVGQELVVPGGTTTSAAEPPERERPEDGEKESTPAMTPEPAAPAAPEGEAPAEEEEAESPAAAPTVMEHVVYPGETLEEIARQYATTVDKLRDLNELRGPVQLQQGQTILVPVGD
ncbi:LysM peptidoglycan-binding domain-containing protein [Kiritimatiella glycovorans]|nr:LysM peptidoglycan-binding domain-containing protein [Kiritimatiella glycovorans]